MKKPVLYIIIPCYNEEEVLPITSVLFVEKLMNLCRNGLIGTESKIMFVDDGSRDKTWDLIQCLAEKELCVIGIRQHDNWGHQNAVLAGMMEARNQCDIAITIDCDGQDDMDAMDDMIRAYLAGVDIVYGVRSDRSTDTFWKKHMALAFYQFMQGMGTRTIFNHADYRLVSNRVLLELEKYEEVNIFLRGLFPLMGFKSDIVYYERKERMAGKSHYPFRKMMALALNGITSLSIRPIRIIAVVGIIIAILSFCGIIWSVVSAFCGQVVEGWASMTCMVCFIGGVQLISIGVLGEYIGKIYMEVKRRPRYNVCEKIIKDRENRME